MKIVKARITRADLTTNWEPIRMSPEWYKARGLPYGSMDTSIPGPLRMQITLDFLPDQDFLEEYVKMQGEPTQPLLDVELVTSAG